MRAREGLLSFFFFLMAQIFILFLKTSGITMSQ